MILPLRSMNQKNLGLAGLHSMDNRTFGNHAETYVTQELKKDGFTILERNYQKLYGEIDIIAQKKDLLVFVEVKVRRTSYVAMQEIITATKQHKIGLVAQEYMVRHKVIDKICRFDVALVQAKQTDMQMTYIPNAFTLE